MVEKTYAFWNNKGGTGKTSLAFQAISRYAELHPDDRFLVVDMCPQANLSELLLGGLDNGGSNRLLMRHGQVPRCSIGGYFQLRLSSPYKAPADLDVQDFLTTPHEYHEAIPENIDLVCGDPLLELQANAVSTLANTQLPGTDTWVAIIDWLRDLVERVADSYNAVFIDCNPSFSMYTQIALASADRIVVPVMADDSSRRAVQNAFSLIYGLKLPSEIYSEHAFATRLKAAKRVLPRVHLIAKNRITQYMGPASAYAAVLSTIESDIRDLMLSHAHLFTNTDTKSMFVNIRDFQTTGVIAYAKGLPFSRVSTGRQKLGDDRVQVKSDYLVNSRNAIQDLVDRL